MAADGSTDLRQTPLHALHVALGGKMVPFAGYEMPVQYPTGIIAEHLHTRTKAGLFDVSHMGQVTLPGVTAAMLETLVPGDIAGLAEGRMRYSLLLNDEGGIIDDLMALRVDDGLQLVVNAATKDGDVAHLRARLGASADVVLHDDRALLALQGPEAAAVLARIAGTGVTTMPFLSCAQVGELFITRSGYTGEDGFEISVAADRAVELAERLLAEPEVLPIGLGARDSLRLEAGLCLYGHDMDENTDPVTANLAWAIGKRRKMDKDFLAADVIMGKLANGTPKKRVGILPDGKAPARDGVEVADKLGRIIGKITSGSFGPTLNAPVAMGYVETQFAKDGTEVDLMVRGKAMPAHVAPMPFVPHRYKRST